MIEVRICQNCKKEFVIEPEDFEFYKRINVPPPTWCSECRMIRRMVWMNQRVLYKRNCDLCGKEIFSMYSKDFRGKVYCNRCWWNKFDASTIYKEYDFNKPFFEQLKELFYKIPKLGVNRLEPTIVNSNYCNICSEIKDCYLLFNSDYSQSCAYGTFVENSKDSYDLYLVDGVELSYNCVSVYKSYKVFYSCEISECENVWFSYNLRSCKNCFGCINLRNKEYYIFNKPFSKEDYFREFEKINPFNFKNHKIIQEKLQNLLNSLPVRFRTERQNYNVFGDYIYNSKNVYDGYQIVETENSKYVSFLTIPKTFNSYDFTMWGGGVDLMYECMGCGGEEYNVKFSFACWLTGYNFEYCIENQGGGKMSHLFGCIGLRNKQYCILNKQYTKQEYEALVPKIIEHMNKMPYIDKQGRVYKYGEFFPPELSPFAYNETIAQEYFPLTKEEAIEKGYRWKEPEERNIKPDIYTLDLPDHIKDVKDDIVGKIIQCQHSKIKEDGTLEQNCNQMCTTAFKIIEPELEFYKRMNLPLPRLCPNCRHFERLKLRNPLKLWKRKCQCAGNQSENGLYQNASTHFHRNQPCPNEFQTTYSPTRPEIVYCEECYNSEVV